MCEVNQSNKYAQCIIFRYVALLVRRVESIVREAFSSSGNRHHPRGRIIRYTSPWGYRAFRIAAKYAVLRVLKTVHVSTVRTFGTSKKLNKVESSVDRICSK